MGRGIEPVREAGIGGGGDQGGVTQLACCWARLQEVPTRPVMVQRWQDGATAPSVLQMAMVMALPMKGAAWAASSVCDGGYGG